MIKKLTDIIAFRVSTGKLKKYFGSDEIEYIIDATKNYVGHGFYSRIAMSQKRFEIISLAKEAKAINPKTIVEIGTRKGGTLFTWCRFTKASKIISIDLQGGIHGGGYPAEKQKLYKYFLSDQPGREVLLIQNDSHKQETLDELKKMLGNDPIDFLFIDGDHTYKGIKNDFEMYAPLVRKGGLIAFHDIIPNITKHEDAATIEVHLFWQEIKNKYKHQEFIESKEQKNMGIGVLYI